MASVATCVLVVTGAMTACLLPPELEAGTFDAGLSSPPVVISAGPAPDFSFPGPIVLDRQDGRALSLTVVDNDIADGIFVRLYVDYGRPNPLPAYAECQAPSTGELSRVVVCPMNTVCNPIASTDQGDHVLEAMVADRGFIADTEEAAQGQPLYRALPSRAAHTFRSWIVRCNPPEGN